MHPKRWQRVQEILLAALELEAEERDAYLEKTCPDEEIRREVESLLASDTELVRGLDRPAFDLLEAPGDTTPEADTPRPARADTPAKAAHGPGVRVGSYRLVREIGRGGMGTVWLAARDDREFERRVAIKILKRGMDTDEIVRRFRLERQILANLEHPHVAELYEGGTTEDHRPYFVMEYVDGLPIDEYCDHHALDLEQRLALFRKVCGAVQFLHRNLVVHRDLKPSNLLVTRAGEPKILDFGIAKLLDPATQRPVTLTDPGWRFMTPECASPEQVRGEPITTATDVYALGVLLYELLTGHRPYQLPKRLDAEIQRIICEVEPEPPSAAVVRSEVITRADGTTVVVDPETVGKVRGERPARLRRRLSGDLDNIVLMALRKEPERRYPSVALLAEDLDRFLDGLPVRAHRDSWLYRTGKLFRRRWRAAAAGLVLLVLATASVLDHLEQQRQVERERDQALRVTRFLTDLFQDSDPYQRNGESLTARSLLDRGVARIEQEPHLEPEIRGALVQTIGEVYRRLALYEEAEPLLEEAHELRRTSHGPESLQLAETLASLAALAADRGDLETAEARYQLAVAIGRRTADEADPDVAARLNALAFVVQSRGDYERAEALHEEALALLQSLHGDDHPEVALTLNDLAVLHLRRDDPDVAEELLRRALAVERQHFGPRHPRLEAVLGNLAAALMAQGREAEAEPLLREARSIAVETLGPDHPSVARLTNSLAVVRRKLGDLEEAESLYRQALDIARRAYGEQHPNVARTMNGLAVVLQNRGQLAAAEPLLLHSLRIQREHLGPEHPGVGAALALLAKLRLAAGDPEPAENLVREALRIFHLRLPPDHSHFDLAEQILGGSLAAQGRFEEAEALLTQSFDRIRSRRGEQDLESREARTRMVSLYEAWGRPEQAEAYRLPD